MKRRWLPVPAALILLLPLIAAGAGKPAPTTPGNTAAPETPKGPPKTMIARFVSVKNSYFQGYPAGDLTVAPALGGGEVKMKVYPLDKDIMDFAQELKPGDYVSLTYGAAGSYLFVSRIEAYSLKLGEDLPGMFLFSKCATEKVKDKDVTGIKVTRFGAELVLVVPQAKNDQGKMAPKEDLMKAIDGFKPGNVVEVKFSGTNLQSIKAYQPPQLGVFQKVEKVKVDDKDVTTVKIRIEGDIQTLTIARKDSALLAKAHGFKKGDLVYCQTTTDDKGAWLTDIQLAPKGTKRPHDAPKDETSQPK